MEQLRITFIKQDEDKPDLTFVDCHDENGRGVSIGTYELRDKYEEIVIGKFALLSDLELAFIETMIRERHQTGEVVNTEEDNLNDFYIAITAEQSRRQV